MRRSSLALLGLFACSKDVHTDVDTDPGVDSDVEPIVILDSVAPGEAMVGATVTLSGTGFLSAAGQVTVAGVTAAITTWSDTEVTLVVPDVFPGVATVMLTNTESASDDGALSIVLPPALYVNLDVSPNYLAALVFDPATAKFSEMSGSPLALGYDTPGSLGYGGESSSVHVNVATRRAFASGAGFLSVFDIDPVTAALTEVTGSPFGPEDATPSHYGITTDAGGDRVYVADHLGFVYGYAVDGGGALTDLPGSPYVASDVDTLMLRSDGAYLYANNESSGLDAFEVGVDGALTRLAAMPFATGSYAFGAKLRPRHDQIFIPQTAGIGVYDVSAADGVPVAIVGSPFLPSSFPATINAMAFAPSGDRVWVGEFSGVRYWVFDVASSGALTEIAGSPFTIDEADQQTSMFVMSRDGAHLGMVSEGYATIATYSVDSSGELIYVPDSQVHPSAPAWNASGVAATF